jgi:hypothetical protein
MGLGAYRSSFGKFEVTKWEVVGAAKDEKKGKAKK